MALPAEVVVGLQMLPSIAEHTRAMAEHTAVLHDVTRALESVASDTSALPALRKEMARVSKATAVLGPMDGRMAKIEAAMPALADPARAVPGGGSAPRDRRAHPQPARARGGRGPARIGCPAWPPAGTALEHR